jgi:hypothetical protein
MYFEAGLCNVVFNIVILTNFCGRERAVTAFGSTLDSETDFRLQFCYSRTPMYMDLFNDLRGKYRADARGYMEG